MYKIVIISFEKAIKKAEGRNWKFICENGHGSCYWNYKNGELLWIDDTEDSTWNKKIK